MIVISNPTSLDHEHELVRQLFDAGMTWFHVRKNDDVAAYLDGFTKEERSRMVLHGDLNTAWTFGLGGVHFNKDLPYREVNFAGLTSYAAHSLDEVKEMDGKVERIILSPIYDSISKPDHQPSFTSEQLRTFFATNELESRIVALGGIDASNATEALEIGFDDVAVLGAIWSDGTEGSIERFKQIKDSVVTSAN